MIPDDEFTVLPLPKTRIAIGDMLREGKKRQMVHYLLEIDVTWPRQKIKHYRQKRGEKISFTGFIVYCLATAVAENKIMHGYRNWRNQLILFDEVDINTQVERNINGRQWVMPYIIRTANKKSLWAIHQEIRQAQQKEVAGSREFRQYGWYLRQPRFVRSFFWWLLRGSPHLTKKIAGTVGVTAVGMFGKGGGWGLPITTQTLLLTLGGIEEKLGVYDEQICPREYLNLTISFDHSVIDHTAAARFEQRLAKLIENSQGLREL